MTHDILPSDIELAIRLRQEGLVDEQIITALTHRGIVPNKAAQLLADLRDGKKMLSGSILPPEFSPSRRSRSRSNLRSNGQAQASPSSASTPRRQPTPPPSRPNRKATNVSWRIAAILIALVVIAGAVVLLQQHHERTTSGETEANTPPKPQGNNIPQAKPDVAAVPVQKPSPGGLALELQPDGLHVSGRLVTRANLLPAMATLLGTPTRTNQVPGTGTVIYAYDRQGVLVYSQPRGGTNSIVLDCEATGGANGTTSPFAGSLTINDQAIGPDTDAQTLAAIKALELRHRGTDTTVWAGRYHDLELVFAYLRSARHLSLIEIDLK